MVEAGESEVRDRLADLVDDVIATSTSNRSHWHGDEHWRRVAAIGLSLCEQTPEADPMVLFLFALFHDSQRFNEDDDPGHGARAGKSARRLVPERLTLQADRLERLVFACRHHTDGDTASDALVGVCWDADRLDLWRVGIKPHRAYISTAAGLAHSRLSEDICIDPPRWDDLVAQAAEQAQARNGSERR